LLSERRIAESAAAHRFPETGKRSRRNCANGARTLLNIVGGCCGTTPPTSKKIAERFAA